MELLFQLFYCGKKIKYFLHRINFMPVSNMIIQTVLSFCTVMTVGTAEYWKFAALEIYVSR